MNTANIALIETIEMTRPTAKSHSARARKPEEGCRHCGAALTTDAMRTSGFCCAGCTYVYRLVHEHGLEAYYKIKDQVVAPAGEVVFQPRDYAWLAPLQTAAEAAQGTPEMTLEVQGISCAGCVWLIEKVFDQQPSALAIETDAQLGRMRLQWARGEFSAEAFARALQSFNYLVGPPGAEPEVPESKRIVKLVGLSAAFSMNVMLFTLPVYFGMEAEFTYAHLFSTLSLVFATLSVLTGGMFFIKRAVHAVRVRTVHIDQPIAVGIIGAYLGSFYGWLRGEEHFIYFDFVSAFILLMLVGRWAQVAAVERNRRRLLTAHDRPQAVEVISDEGGRRCAVENLRAGDVMRVRSGQVIPVESQLETPVATIGTAWISGEADPRECRVGARVPAGAVNLGRGDIQLRATQPWADSLLAQLLKPSTRKEYRHTFIDRVIRGYLIAIFVVAIGSGVSWWMLTHDVVRTWSVVTAVLVVSCPCAIGLAFPLADEIATVALRRKGVFVRESDLWPRLKKIRKIIFDKTGTLTLEAPQLKNAEVLAGLTAAERAALFALTRDNPHPVSQALTEELLSRNLVSPAGGIEGAVTEVPGFGVTMKTEQGTWALGRPGWVARDLENDIGTLRAGEAVAEDGHDAEFTRDRIVLAKFRFADAVRDDAVAEFAALKQRGLELFILSGDRREKVNALARLLRFPTQRCIAGVTPEQKSAWIRAKDIRDTLMLGDGANDSLAFDAAFARGTPVVHRGVLQGKADFYYLGRNLAGIRQLFEVDAMRRRTHAWLLGFSIVYNLCAVGLAVVGHMNPLLAAILMPVSSMINLAIVGAGLRGVLVRR